MSQFIFTIQMCWLFIRNMAMELLSNTNNSCKEIVVEKRRNFNVLIIILCVVIFVLILVIISLLFKKTCNSQETMKEINLDMVHAAGAKFLMELGCINNKTYYISRELEVIKQVFHFRHCQLRILCYTA